MYEDSGHGYGSCYIGGHGAEVPFADRLRREREQKRKEDAEKPFESYIRLVEPLKREPNK